MSIGRNDPSALRENIFCIDNMFERYENIIIGIHGDGKFILLNK